MRCSSDIPPRNVLATSTRPILAQNVYNTLGNSIELRRVPIFSYSRTGWRPSPLGLRGVLVSLWDKYGLVGTIRPPPS
ncbi:hypothetical protein C8Q79DRAFT_938096 [Trametes meyenii]|nr:hypothetical protein C8Q79DRAFT_938096 [Trametes meyenii]